MSDWDRRFLDMAALVSTWSKDPSTKVGAVITRGKFVISLGFNGHPSGIDDSTARLHDRETKYRTIIHAELNAILSAHQPLEGCTLYVVPFMPCSNCGAVIVQSGIKRVVTYENNNERWAESFEITRTIFAEAGIDLIILPARND
ncbi:MAG TPA: dCMP deaminase family protein [Terracidiphilus sp.]|jgi:dCMP deaminase|nr:dCMP deaminase family protein [Terracidiphilus sp.]